MIIFNAGEYGKRCSCKFLEENCDFNEEVMYNSSKLASQSKLIVLHQVKLHPHLNLVTTVPNYVS